MYIPLRGQNHYPKTVYIYGYISDRVSTISCKVGFFNKVQGNSSKGKVVMRVETVFYESNKKSNRNTIKRKQ